MNDRQVFRCRQGIPGEARLPRIDAIPIRAPRMLYKFDSFVLDSDRFTLSRDGVEQHVEPQVIELLLYLVVNRDRLVTREELIDTVWKGRLVSDSAISGRIKVARRVLGDDGRRQRLIRTVHKKGFSFVASVESGSPQAAGRVASQPQADRSIKRKVPGYRPALCVFAFTCLDVDPERSFFAEGLTEDLVTVLSKISRMVVIGVPEMRDGETMEADSRIAGDKLKADYFLYGSVRSDAERLRISVRLVAAASGEHLWADRYDCLYREVFDLQDRLTREIVSALQVELTEGEQALLLSHGTDNVEAWQLTFQGQAAVLDHHRDGVRRGRQQLQAALQLDENYALAWSALAIAHWKESLNEGWSESCEKSLQLALEASERALELEPENARTIAMRSLMLVTCRLFEEAVSLANDAIRQAGSDANTIALAAITLRACCLPERSIVHTRKAMQLYPVYPAWYPYGIAVCLWMSGRHEEALDFAAEAIEIDDAFSLTYFLKAMLHAERGESEQARAAVNSLLSIDPGFTSRAYTRGMPFSEPEMNARRDRAIELAGLP